jgi:glycosyltransferase involved in cell wall biosynthesis
VKQNAIAFSGNLEFPPNIAAVSWFAREVWPQLSSRFPDLEWRIIGKGPEFVRDLVKSPRIRLTGPVPDAVDELAAAQVAIVPIQSGSGTRLKILEAWAAHTAVVSTPLGAEGLDAGDAVQVAVAPVDFLEAVSLLLTNAIERERVASSGRGLYERRFTWEAAWRSLKSNGI